jgi:hypothetical protein
MQYTICSLQAAACCQCPRAGSALFKCLTDTLCYAALPPKLSLERIPAGGPLAANFLDMPAFSHAARPTPHLSQESGASGL